MTARDKILTFLATREHPIPLHDMDICGVSQTSASARLRELARENLVESVRVDGKKYTAWVLKKDLALFPGMM